MMYISYSNGDREIVDDLEEAERKAAALRPETAHLGPGCDLYTARVIINEDFCENGRYYHRGDYSPWHHDFDKVYEGGVKFQTQAEVNTFLATAPQPESVTCGETLVSFSWQVSKRSLENREKYSMGAGYFLGKDRHSGWQVRKSTISSYSESDICLALGNN